MREKALFDAIKQHFKLVELFFYYPFARRVRSDAHQPDDAYVSQGGQFFLTQQLDDCFVVEPELGVFIRDANLQQAVDTAIVLLALLVDLLQQLEAVYAVYQRNERRDVFHLVALQVAYHVPLDVFRQLLVFFDQFLHDVFAEDALAGVVGFLDVAGGLCLGYGYERNTQGVRLLSNGGYILCDCHSLLGICGLAWRRRAAANAAILGLFRRKTYQFIWLNLHKTTKLCPSAKRLPCES